MEERTYLPFKEVYTTLSLKELNKKFDVKSFSVANTLARGRAYSNDNRGDRKRSKLRTCTRCMSSLRCYHCKKNYHARWFFLETQEKVKNLNKSFESINNLVLIDCLH